MSTSLYRVVDTENGIILATCENLDQVRIVMESATSHGLFRDDSRIRVKRYAGGDSDVLPMWITVRNWRGVQG